MKGLLVDSGRVLTTNVFDSSAPSASTRASIRNAIKRLFREHPEALRMVRALETGDSSEEFGERFGELLG
jgi:acyl-CoA reductase-like NAD-dependent aldehyde dehydrogenase